MEKRDWMNLQSGTDVRGTAVEGVAGDPVTLTDEAVGGILRAYCFALAQKLGKQKLTIAIGHDSRLSAGRIVACAAEAAAGCGCDVLLLVAGRR